MSGWDLAAANTARTIARHIYRPSVLLAAAAVVALLLQFAVGAPALGAHTAAPDPGSYVLTASSTGGNYAPTFTGNG